MGEPATEQGESTLREGLLVEGKYRLIEPRGEGAMGSVWSAQHTTLGHLVAVKFLHGSVATSAEPRARFEREARLAARLGEASRHITRVTDHGITSEGTPFLVMELLQGEGLEVRLKRDRRLPISLVAKIISQLCRALHVAHGAGVIHRDLKPANIFLCEEDGDVFVKLLDFGVAKATLDNDENQATRAGALIGTPNYMSPEQISGDSAVDARSDLWAVAAMAFRMAAGKPPFGSGSLSELAMRIVSTEPPVATQLAPDLPAEFDLWVQKGLAKRPDQRFQSARELADSLSMVSGLSANGGTGAYSSTAAERLAIQLADSVTGLQHTLADVQRVPPQPPAPQPRSRAPLFATFGLLAIVGVGAGLYLAQNRGSSTSNPSAAAQTPDKPAATDTAKSTTSATPTAVAADEKKPDEAPTAPATSATPSTTDDASAAKALATAAGKAPLPAWKPKSGATKPVTDEKPATPPPVVTTPPTPTPTPDLNKKSDDLWKKKDEM